MRRTRYDVAVLANGGCMPRPLRWAKQIGARHILGFSEPGNPLANQINLPVVSPAQVMHEVEMLMTLMQPLTGEIVPAPNLSLVAAAIWQKKYVENCLILQGKTGWLAYQCP
jgi:hypothetical protein